MATEVPGIISAARAYAADYVAQADGLMARISELSEIKIEIPEVDEAKYTNYDDARVFALQETLSIFPYADESLMPKPVPMPNAPPEPSFSDVNEAEIDPFDMSSAPDVVMPKVPSALNLNPPGAAPVIQQAVLPEAPTLAMPTLPTLSDITLPVAPTILTPEFDADAPEFDIGAPTENFAFAESEYQSAILDSLKVKLLNDLQDGGYGIEPGDEAALWDRAREREAQVANEAADSVAREFGSRGFLVPPGALFGELEGIRARAMQSANALSRDVALKRADLYVQNRQFTVQQVQQLESTLINQHMSVMERILNAAKATAQFAIDYYRARLDEQKARLDTYQAKAQVYGERVRAEAQKVEVFRSLILAEQAKGEVDKSRVDLYRAQLTGVEALVTVYRSQLEAANVFAQVEQTKLEAYKIMVDGYVAGVKAKEAEFGMYEAGVRGEQAKVQMFGEKVRAHVAKVEAAKVKAEIENTRVGSEIAKAKLVMENFSERVRSAKIESDQSIATSELALRAYGVNVDAFRANNSMVGEVSKMVMQGREGWLKLQDLKYNVNLDRAKLTLEKLKAQYDLQITAGVKGAEIYQELIQGALSSITSIASLSE